MLLIIPRRLYILSQNYYLELSFSENVLICSVKTVHNPHTTTMYGSIILKMLLVILRKLYILFTLQSENVFSYTMEIVHTAHITAIFS